MTLFITEMKNGNPFAELRKNFAAGRCPASALTDIWEPARPKMRIESRAMAVPG